MTSTLPSGSRAITIISRPTTPARRSSFDPRLLPVDRDQSDRGIEIGYDAAHRACLGLHRRLVPGLTRDVVLGHLGGLMAIEGDRHRSGGSTRSLLLVPEIDKE